MNSDRRREAIRELAAEFFNRESNKSSLITVTGARMTDDAKRITILITVLPEEKETEALSFLKRKRSDLRGKILKELDITHPPFVDIEIDRGEKNRRRIEELSKE